MHRKKMAMPEKQTDTTRIYMQNPNAIVRHRC